MITRELFCIALASVFVADISMFADTIKRPLSRWLGVRIDTLKPLDCSLCLTFWLGTAYLLLNGFTLERWALVCLYAAMTPAMAEGVHTLRDLIIRILRLIQKL